MKINKTKAFIGALAGAALTLAGSFNVRANPPPQGSPQWNLMSPHSDFINNMRYNLGSSYNGVPSTGSCCNWSDGRGDMEERQALGADGKMHYQVKATREAFGEEYFRLIPPEGLWVDVPDDRVLSPEQAEKFCAPVKTRSPDNNTCEAPMFNILWLAASPQSPGNKPYVYCYWAVPKLGALEHKSDSKFAAVAPQPPQPAVR